MLLGIKRNQCLGRKTAQNYIPLNTVKKNPSKQLFSTEAGREKHGFPSPIVVGTKGAFTIAIDGGAHCHGECKRWISSFAAPSLACLFVAWLPSLRSCFGTVLWTVFGKFHSPRKVDNSFLGRASAYRHSPLCRSLTPRLWLTQLSHSVRPFPTANRATSFPALFR